MHQIQHEEKLSGYFLLQKKCECFLDGECFLLERKKIEDL